MPTRLRIGVRWAMHFAANAGRHDSRVWRNYLQAICVRNSRTVAGSCSRISSSSSAVSKTRCKASNPLRRTRIDIVTLPGKWMLRAST